MEVQLCDDRRVVLRGERCLRDRDDGAAVSARVDNSAVSGVAQITASEPSGTGRASVFCFHCEMTDARMPGVGHS